MNRRHFSQRPDPRLLPDACRQDWRTLLCSRDVLVLAHAAYTRQQENRQWRLSQFVLRLRRINRVVLTQQRREQREVLHRYRLRAEQIMCLHETRELRLRRIV